MARPRDFDKDQALDAAVMLFWRQGFAATSVRGLCDAIGIQPGSFYAAFESKEACFRMVLERYIAAQSIPRTPSPLAVRAWLEAVIAPERRGLGCLLINSAVEVPMLDPESRTFVLGCMGAVEAFFAQCLAGHADPKGDAALVSATVSAIHIQARMGASTQKLRALADRTLLAIGQSPLLHVED